jgi:4-hydroxybenzoate polyprenyltransferase
MKQLAPIGDVLMGSNLWLAIGASTMISASIFCLKGVWEWNELEIWVFFATLSLYNWHRVLGFKKNRPNPALNNWVNSHRQAILGTALLASFCAGVLYLLLPLKVQLALLIPCALGLGYSLPIFPKQKRLRDVPRLKILVLASVWAWVVVCLPRIFVNIPLSPITGLFFLEKWLFFFAIAIGFDIRDVAFDLSQGVLTLPGKLGIKAAKSIGILALLLAIGIGTSLYADHCYALSVYAADLVCLICTGLLLFLANPQRSPAFFNLLLDGMLILQPLGLFLFNAFFLL